MKIQEALRIAVDQLKHNSQAKDLSICYLEGRLLLAKILNKPLEYLLTHHHVNINQDLQQQFFLYIKRRLNYEPISYILGYKEFYSRNFFITKDVLIPRPETELLVETIINTYNKYYYNTNVDILDLGTGSGIIAITLALEIINSNICALDICPKSLDVANKNIKSYNLEHKIDLIFSNWYSNLSNKKFDFIVSNPPYINIEKEQYLMSLETILHEPKIALYAYDQGLYHYKIIISRAQQFLKNNGIIFLEIGPTQYHSIANIIKKISNLSIQSTYYDLQGHIRVLVLISSDT